MFHPRFKVTNELRYVRTDSSGSWETDFEELKLKGNFLTDIMPFGIKAKLALGAEWLKDLGDFDKGTGSGSDQIAPLAGIGWIPTDLDFIITLVQYFHSYDTHDGGPKVRKTTPRLIYIIFAKFLRSAAGSKPIIKERSIMRTTETIAQPWNCSSAKCLRRVSVLTSKA